ELGFLRKYVFSDDLVIFGEDVLAQEAQLGVGVGLGMGVADAHAILTSVNPPRGGGELSCRSGFPAWLFDPADVRLESLTYVNPREPPSSPRRAIPAARGCAPATHRSSSCRGGRRAGRASRSAARRTAPGRRSPSGRPCWGYRPGAGRRPPSP